MHVTAVVLAAGRGLRLKSKIPKPLFELGAKPVIIYSLLVLSQHRYIKDIVLVVNGQNKNKILRQLRCHRIDRIARVVEGGVRRQDSVLNGLKAINSRTDFVLIHDGVRPFIEEETVSAVIKAARKTGAAIVGVPVKATIKKVKKSQSHKVTKSPVVEKTLDREQLWEIQTPQVFRKDLILEAYRRFSNIDVTDDATLVEKLGCKVSVIPGTYNNIKITTPEDLVIAQAILKSKKSKLKSLRHRRIRLRR
jgi:2-C-methyl-D-erythritol 4-phosphate cytidylyltransferase